MTKTNMDDKNFLCNYLESHLAILKNTDITEKAITMRNYLINANSRNNRVIFAGNGASSAIASHASLDFKKQAKINSLSFSDAAFITAYSNDYGYDNWLAKAIEHNCTDQDVIVLISSSGKSQNILNAAQYAQKNHNTVVSFTGFNKNNPLDSLSDLGFWVDSHAYNIIENVHQIWLMGICDLIIGKTEYNVTE